MNKKLKKYLICDETGNDFLIEAIDAKDAGQQAARMASEVKAIWFEHPSNKDLNDKWDYV